MEPIWQLTVPLPINFLCKHNTATPMQGHYESYAPCPGIARLSGTGAPLLCKPGAQQQACEVGSTTTGPLRCCSIGPSRQRCGYSEHTSSCTTRATLPRRDVGLQYSIRWGGGEDTRNALWTVERPPQRPDDTRAAYLSTSHQQPAILYISCQRAPSKGGRGIASWQVLHTSSSVGHRQTPSASCKPSCKSARKIKCPPSQAVPCTPVK